MAKSGVFERDPTDNLKKELQKLVKSIVEEENGFEFTNCIDKATQTLQALKDLKEGIKYCFDSCPQEFICPLSNQIMRDPVIISSGITYDRVSIQKWLKSGSRICPKSEQVLSHTILTPNCLVQDMILQWCKNRGLGIPSVIDQNPSTESNHTLFVSLLNKLSSATLQDQKEAAASLRSLTKKIPSFRAFFGESDHAILQLLSPLLETQTNRDLQEDLITTILNISIHDNNKKLVAETPNAIPILLHAVKSGSIESRSNAAATLFTLSALDVNKSVIGKSGGLKPLIDLLDEGHVVAMKDAASAIFNLCIVHENKSRAVRDGAVTVILRKIAERVHVDELLAILAMLSSNQKAVEEMCDLGGVSCLLSLIKETSCDRNIENCIAILYTICFNDRTKWREMREEESEYGTLSRVAREGTSRAKRKANGILDRINRPINRTHTA